MFLTALILNIDKITHKPPEQTYSEYKLSCLYIPVNYLL